MGKFQDLTGKQFSRLTVIERMKNHKYGMAQWLCKCECGNLIVVTTSNLKSENTKSCGCARIETIREARKQHGQTHTRLYRIWIDMKRRCGNPSREYYKYYGAEGKFVCEEWLHDFQAFYDWAMANGYSADLTLDRINGTKEYSPDNCRWATQKVQQNNRRNNRLITYNGKTQTIAQWAGETNMDRSTLRRRLIRGWSVEKTLTTPTRKLNANKKEVV